MRTNTRPKDPVDTTETSFEIIEHLDQDGWMSIGEVADSLGLVKSTAHRHLTTLEKHGFVVREDDQFKVGLRFLDLGINARNRLDFYSVGKEKVDLLAKDTNEKARLITEENGLSVLVYRKMGDHPLRATEHIGNCRPLHQLAAGKAIMASMPRDEVDRIIETVGLPTRTKNTITDKEALFEEIEQIRDRGYAFNRGESVTNLNAIGAAVQNEDGTPICALSISGAANRLQGDYLEKELRDQLLGIVNEMEITIRHEL